MRKSKQKCLVTSLSINTDDKTTVGFVQEKLAQTINDNWKFRDGNSLSWMTELCRKGFCHGVFVDGKLAAWILMFKKEMEPKSKG